MQDRNFDDIAEKFSRNIYGTTKGQLRQAILWQDLEPLLAQLGPGPLRVLDAGGGEGQTAIKVAQLGHHVTLCDLSAEMVARARQAAADKGVIDNMHFVQCAAQDIAQHLESRSIWYCFMRCWSGWRSPRKYCIPCGRRCVLAVDCH
ncbi:putative metallothionein SmtA [Klebsiella pneumoniae]|uniref:Putative metallothionein SmtA n=1 Tax=Klebsiella pneumoniae TaxID=573 RepID=A0A2X3GQA3_KLEPN|nr:putative metallothionein SmtA [Klebsiella pneumoniae]